MAGRKDVVGRHDRAQREVDERAAGRCDPARHRGTRLGVRDRSHRHPGRMSEERGLLEHRREDVEVGVAREDVERREAAHRGPPTARRGATAAGHSSITSGKRGDSAWHTAGIPAAWAATAAPKSYCSYTTRSGRSAREDMGARSTAVRRAITSTNNRAPMSTSGRPSSPRGISPFCVRSEHASTAPASIVRPTLCTANPSAPSLDRNAPVVANSTSWPPARAARARGIIG